MDKLAELNAAEEDQALSIIVPLIERSYGIAKRVAGRRPFENVEALAQAIRAELFGLNLEQRIELFRAHPELAPKYPMAMTPASQYEQGRLKLTAQDGEYRARLAALNARYNSKFGFPFITALCRHRDMTSVVAEFERRLEEDRDSETSVALDQIAAVTASRIRSSFATADEPAIMAGLMEKPKG